MADSVLAGVLGGLEGRAGHKRPRCPVHVLLAPRKWSSVDCQHLQSHLEHIILVFRGSLGEPGLLAGLLAVSDFLDTIFTGLRSLGTLRIREAGELHDSSHSSHACSIASSGE